MEQTIQIVHKSVEEYCPEALFDSVISRAFSTLYDYVSPSQRLVKTGGQILAMKGVYPLTELQDVAFPFQLVEIYPLKVSQLNAERHLVELSYQPEMREETAAA